MRSPGERPSVLLVEDQPLISLDLCEILTQAGYQVIGPANTTAAVRFLLQRNAPCVAIVDVFVRDGTSAEVVRELRRRNVPYLVHSRHPRDEAAASDCGTAPWLAKPACSSDLLNLLGNMREPEMTS